jgi:hypothetical protein
LLRPSLGATTELLLIAQCNSELALDDDVRTSSIARAAAAGALTARWRETPALRRASRLRHAAMSSARRAGPHPDGSRQAATDIYEPPTLT